MAAAAAAFGGALDEPQRYVPANDFELSGARREWSAGRPGYAKVVSVMAMEHVRRALIRIFGTPGGAAPWGWQLGALVGLVAAFAGRLPEEVAAAELARAAAAGPENLAFAWAGDTAPGERHYYRVQGPGLLIEHDNTQGGGNHVHSVWRNPGNDFGDGILAAHHRAEHSER
jgi:Protein of unknown function (DUF3500)